MQFYNAVVMALQEMVFTLGRVFVFGPAFFLAEPTAQSDPANRLTEHVENVATLTIVWASNCTTSSQLIFDGVLPPCVFRASAHKVLLDKVVLSIVEEGVDVLARAAPPTSQLEAIHLYRHSIKGLERTSRQFPGHRAF